MVENEPEYVDEQIKMESEVPKNIDSDAEKAIEEKRNINLQNILHKTMESDKQDFNESKMYGIETKLKMREAIKN